LAILLLLSFKNSGPFVPILNHKRAAIARAKAAKNCHLSQKTDLIQAGRFFFLGIANRAHAWYNMTMEEDTVMRGIMEWRRLR
jgi:sensor domain CHASE-containing protein